MIKKILEEGKQFHIQQKETYTFDDVKNTIEQYKGFIIKEGENLINDKFTSLEEELKTANSEKEEFANSIKELKTKSEEDSKLIESLKDELLPFKEQTFNEKAKEFLKGLVAEGAEKDAFKAIEEEVKEMTFEDGEDKSEKLSPILDKLFENKPYFKKQETIVSDEEEVFEENKAKETIKEKEYTGENIIRNI